MGSCVRQIHQDYYYYYYHYYDCIQSNNIYMFMNFVLCRVVENLIET